MSMETETGKFLLIGTDIYSENLWTPMFCNNCGTKNPDGAKYCSVCGTRMSPPETTVSGSDSDSSGRCDKSDSDKENFRKKLRSSIEKDIEGVLDFAVIQVPYGDFVQFLPMEGGGFKSAISCRILRGCIYKCRSLKLLKSGTTLPVLAVFIGFSAVSFPISAQTRHDTWAGRIRRMTGLRQCCP